MTNDLTLLRPFDLAKAKQGELLTTPDNPTQCFWSYAAGPDTHNKIVVKIELGENKGTFTYPTKFDVFCMAPLAWVESRPVYKGDTLYYKSAHSGEIYSVVISGYNPHLLNNTGLLGKISHSSSETTTIGEEMWAPFDCWTWQRSKTKREGWINIYKDTNFIMLRHKTKQEAEKSDPNNYRIDTIHIEWEE